MFQPFDVLIHFFAVSCSALLPPPASSLMACPMIRCSQQHVRTAVSGQAVHKCACRCLPPCWGTVTTPWSTSLPMMASCTMNHRSAFPTISLLLHSKQRVTCLYQGHVKTVFSACIARVHVLTFKVVRTHAPRLTGRIPMLSTVQFCPGWLCQISLCSKALQSKTRFTYHIMVHAWYTL